jgi:16S rRNA (guanine966-N2)-methyltransferase
MGLRIYGNRFIKTLPGEMTRPTLAKVRQAVFNIWQGTIEDCRWLDLCAGSGSMGAEALCRGAAAVVGIEQSDAAVAIVAANWRQLAQPDQVIRILRGDVVKTLKTLGGQQFDRMYFDPPYAGGLYEAVLAAIVTHDLLAPTGELAVEHDPKYAIAVPVGLTVCREKAYGRTALTFYRRTLTNSAEATIDFG